MEAHRVDVIDCWLKKMNIYNINVPVHNIFICRESMKLRRDEVYAFRYSIRWTTTRDTRNKIRILCISQCDCLHVAR